MNGSKDRDVKITENYEAFKANEGVKDAEKKEKITESNGENFNTLRSSDGGKYSRSFDKWKDYFDFELEISSGIGREYPVSIIRSPAGEVHDTMHFPFDELALENALKDIQIALLRSGGKNRQLLSQEEQTVKDFGQKLFDTLLSGELRSFYDVSLREAEKQGKGLRLKLRIKPPELAALPWEFLYDSHQADYLSLSSNIPVVRYLELPQSIKPLSVDPPLHILGMTASPHDLPLLDVEREKQRVEEAIKDLRERGLVDITWLAGQTWENLQQGMRTGIWHIFHFIGHGGFDSNTDEGLIALADEDGQTFRLSATQLGRFLAGHRHLRLVILNSCKGAQGSRRDIFSSTAAILVRRGIPAVLAMQYEITDKAAIEFARAFYLALADGIPVDAAVAEARIAVSVALTNTIEWGTPVLYMRSPDGVLFKIQKTGEILTQTLPQNNKIFVLSEDANRFFKKGNYEAAITKLQNVLKLDPDNREAMERKIEAEKIIGKINTSIFAAQQLYDKGKYSKAIDKWNEALNLNPENEIAKKGKKEADDRIKKYCPCCGILNVRRKEFCGKCGVRLYRTSG